MTDRSIRNMNKSIILREKIIKKMFLTGDLGLVVFPKTSQPSEAWSKVHLLLLKTGQPKTSGHEELEVNGSFCSCPVSFLTLFCILCLHLGLPKSALPSQTLRLSTLLHSSQLISPPSTRIISDTYWCYIYYSPCWILLFEQNIKILICTYMLLLFSH